jgi:hypothetical protein
VLRSPTVPAARRGRPQPLKTASTTRELAPCPTVTTTNDVVTVSIYMSLAILIAR